MDISYQKNLHKSYMCIENREDIEKSVKEHEVMILQKYKIPQLLPMEIIIQDGRIQYWYEITGKQPLTEYLSGKQIGTRQLKRILLSIEQICRKIPEFLLKEDCLCLQEELLYVDVQEESLYFTYLPFLQGNFLQEFQSWMEEVLKHIEHQDRECTELAYRVYEKSREENISIGELVKEMGIEPEPVLEKQSNIEREKSEKVSLVLEKSQKNFLKNRVEKFFPEMKNRFDEYWKRLKKKEAQKIREMNPKKIKKEPGAEDLSRREHRNTSNVEMQQEKEEKYHTQLLRTASKQPKGKLLYQGEHNCSSFGIVGEEWVIGRNSAQVDGKIETDGISRVHARIIRKPEDYYVEDLNSTNGTYVNGVRLKPYESRKLKQNDKIRFGIEEYVFY